MIARFTLQPEALALSHLEAAPRLAQTELLLRFWREHGVLLIPQRAAGSFAEAVRSLPLPQRKRWQTAVGSAQTRKQFFVGMPNIANQLDLSLVNPEWLIERGLVNVACVHDDELGCEACRADSLAESETVRRIWEYREGELAEGTPIDDVWNRCFSSLVKHANGIAIMDRYAGRDLLITKPERRNGFFSLLDRLPTTGRDRQLKLYTGFYPDNADGYGSKPDVVDAVKAAVDHLLPRNYSFRLYVAEDRVFAERYHFRYVRFDQTWCLKTDDGLRILEGPSLWRPASYHFHTVSDQHIQAENRFTSEFATKALELGNTTATGATI